MHDEASEILAGYLNQRQMAQALGCTVRTLQRWRRERIGPPVSMVGREPHYSVESFRAWLKAGETRMVRDGRAAAEARP